MSESQPVILVPSRFAEWADRYSSVTVTIAKVLPAARVEHIGSTAIPELPAKDVVDVLVGVDAVHLQDAADALAAAGFDLEGSKPGHCWLSAPDRSRRECVVHVVVSDSSEWEARIAFRDLLRSDPGARAEYLATKVAAAAAALGWADYTAAKYPTVSRLLRTPTDANESAFSPGAGPSPAGCGPAASAGRA